MDLANCTMLNLSKLVYLSHNVTRYHAGERWGPANRSLVDLGRNSHDRPGSYLGSVGQHALLVDGDASGSRVV